VISDELFLLICAISSKPEIFIPVLPIILNNLTSSSVAIAGSQEM